MLIVPIVLASAFAWWHVAVCYFQDKEPVRFFPRHAIPWNGTDVLLFACMFLGILVLGNEVLDAFGADRGANSSEKGAVRMEDVLVLSVIQVVAVLVGGGVIVRRSQGRLRDFGWFPRRCAYDTLLGLAGLAAFAVPVYAIQRILVYVWESPGHPLVKLLTHASDSRPFLIAFFTAVIVAPLVEEFIFRVLLQGWLEQISSSARRDQGETPLPGSILQRPYIRPAYWPILVSALVFAMMHAGNGPDPLPLFVLALGLGYLYRQTHRVTPCVIMHACFNSVSLLILWLNSPSAVG